METILILSSSFPGRSDDLGVHGNAQWDLEGRRVKKPALSGHLCGTFDNQIRMLKELLWNTIIINAVLGDIGKPLIGFEFHMASVLTKLNGRQETW